MYILSDRIKKFYCAAGVIRPGELVREKWFTKEKFKKLCDDGVVVKKDDPSKKNDVVKTLYNVKSEKKED